MATADSTSASGTMTPSTGLSLLTRGRPRGRDTQIIHLGQQRDRLHRRAVVRVQDQRLLPALLADDAPLQQRRRLFTALLLMHFLDLTPTGPDTFFPLRVVIPDCAEIPVVNGIPRRCAGGARYNAQTR